MSQFAIVKGFIPTLDPDTDEQIADYSEEENEPSRTEADKQAKKRKKQPKEFNDDFTFYVNSGPSQSDEIWNRAKQWSKQGNKLAIDEKIAKTRRELKEAAATENDSLIPSASTDVQHGANSSGYESDDVDVEHGDRDDVLRERKRKGALKKSKKSDKFFDDATAVDSTSAAITFQEMNLSRPLLKAVTTCNFVQPTPIQAACIPIALMGKDIVACAATGTGKTAAFILPVLDRLLYKPDLQRANVTRVLVIVPTRELAVQVYQMSIQLAQFTKIEIVLCSGGMDSKQQEVALRRNPDIVIATPGRLIDHLLNSPSFNLHNIEVLILDEADRMLDDAFAPQLKEIIDRCSSTRQTMLFSATMTDQVKDLVSVSLKSPCKIFVNQNTDVAANLKQEFVRIRPNRESDRESIVAALVTRTFTNEVLLFAHTKKLCSRMHIVLGLLGVRAAELHGDLSQAQRIDALSRFKSGEIDVLIATDLAARGLDIEGVKTVINLSLPSQMKQYVHRVGRTARAGKAGRSVSLIGEYERKLMKEIVKHAVNPLKQRMIAPDVITAYKMKIAKLEPDIEKIEREADEEKQILIAEKQLRYANRQMTVPAAVEQPKIWVKEPIMKKAKLRQKKIVSRRKMRKEKLKEEFGESERETRRGIKAAKSAGKPKRLRSFGDEKNSRGPAKKPKSAFTNELTKTENKSVKFYRHGFNKTQREKAERLEKKKRH